MSDDAELRFAVLLEEKGRLRLTGVRGIIPRLSYPVPVSQLERPTEYEHGTGGTLNFVLRGCYRGHLKVLGDSMASTSRELTSLVHSITITISMILRVTSRQILELILGLFMASVQSREQIHTKVI